MTAYNAERYIEEAVESVIQQETSYTWELLFVDDGSRDRTLQIMREFSRRSSRQIHFFQHSVGGNRGISASRNLALRYARGAAVAFLDSDDVWLPNHLETQLALLQSMPHVAMVYGGAERWFDFAQPFNEETSRVADWGENCLPPIVPAGQSSGLLPRGKLLDWFRNDESLVPCICTVVLHTEIARAVGGFCEEFRGLYDDQAFHAKVCLAHDVYANDVCTARYRQHPDSCCGKHRTSAVPDATEHDRFQNFLRQYQGGTHLAQPALKLDTV